MSSGIAKTLLVLTLGSGAGVAIYQGLGSDNRAGSPSSHETVDRATDRRISSSRTEDEAARIYPPESVIFPESSPSDEQNGPKEPEKRTESASLDSKDDSKKRSAPRQRAEKRPKSDSPDNKRAEGQAKPAKKSSTTDKSPPKKPSGSHNPGSAAPNDNLAGERRLLNRAREALADGNYASAEQSLRKHRDKFRDGQLSNQRRVLRIEMLKASGNESKARQRAKSFLKNHPDSILSGTVSSMLSEMTK